MYKLTFVTFLVCLACSYALSNDIDHADNCLEAKLAEGRIGEGIIRDIIEKVRKVIKNGDSSLGLPPLDPLDVKNFPVLINNNLIQLDSTWTVKSQGASEFKIEDLSLSLIGLNLKLTFKLPKATASGDYKVDLSSSLISQRIFGEGTFNGKSEGLVVKVKGKLGTKLSGGKLIPQIKKLEVDPSLESFYLDLTGFMNDEELSAQISKTLTNNLPSLLREYKGKLNEVITKLLPIINDVLAKKVKINHVKC